MKKKQSDFWVKVKKLFPEFTKKERPSWYLDLKWVSSLLFFIFFVSALLIYNFSQIVSKKNVVDQMTTNIQTSLQKELTDFFQLANQFLATNENYVKIILNEAKNELDKLAKTSEEASKQTSEQSGEKIQPIKGLDFSIDKNQIDKYSKEIETAIYKEIANSLQEIQDKGLTNATDRDQWQKELTDKINFPKIYSPELHRKYVLISSLLFFISFILFFGAIFFSYAWGRVFTPGLLILLTSIPGFYIFNRAHNYLIHSSLKNLADSSNFLIQLFAQAVYDAFNQQINSIYLVYKVLLVLGIILMITAIAGKIYHHYKNKKKAKK
ncbi:MAG: hypothetical protein WC663_01060 [Patescibacteria group bacterium]|jgi:hypothetical protein